MITPVRGPCKSRLYSKWVRTGTSCFRNYHFYTPFLDLEGPSFKSCHLSQILCASTSVPTVSARGSSQSAVGAAEVSANIISPQKSRSGWNNEWGNRCWKAVWNPNGRLKSIPFEAHQHPGRRGTLLIPLFRMAVFLSRTVWDQTPAAVHWAFF